MAPLQQREFPNRRNIPEKRSSVTEVVDLKSGRYAEIFGTASAAGVPVNESTALGVSAVTACVDLLSGMIAKLPIFLYRDTPQGPEEVTNHPAIRLIGSYPSDLQTSFELRQLMEIGKGLGGNGYARVFRDAFGDPYSIQWLEPCKVSPQLVERSNGERLVVYQVDGKTLTRYDIIHVRGFSRDGVNGISPIRMLRESIGNALSQTKKAGDLMRNGTQFPGFLVTPQSISPDKLKDARDEWDKNYRGGNTGRIPMIHGGWDFKATNGMSMADAQFLDSRRFELQEIARLYRIPSFLIGDSTSSTTWGSGIEQQTLGFLNFSLDPHLVAWEQSLGITLLTTEEQKAGFYFRFDRDQLANVALQAKAAFYQTMRNIGVYSANDIRRKMDEPVISAADGGDDYGRPFNASGGTPQEKPEEDPKPEPEPSRA
ncbi:phage portal protein [Luteolibacter yonseiensis]|uniref:Phage portal protein n=1 Tax=Luteolibacter yonseiensis TaxID=1144680 RepID=A0A934R427_9BACT|nr:phage portal protein [Luteolibacter yonseiensis]MBK1816524.1 phage portal protein [Luteolibacter yonseiensis]